MTDGNTFTEIADGECRRDLPAEDLLFARFRVRTRLQPVPYKPFVLVSRPDGSRRFPSCLSSRPEPPHRKRSGGTCIFFDFALSLRALHFTTSSERNHIDKT